MQQPLTSRPVELFLELCAIPSPSGRGARGRRPGHARARRDRARLGGGRRGPSIGAGSGNVLCRLPGREEGGVPLFLCAHFDTVPLDGELEPVVEDGIVRNAGGAILGADNKSAVVVMVEAARRIVEEGRPHAGIELLFTPKEEIGLVGAEPSTSGRLEARLGYVYDQAAPDRRGHRRLAVGPGAPPHVRRSRRARGDVPRGGPFGDRRGRARDRRHAARPDRRADDRERRPHPRRHGTQRRPRALLARGRGALARLRAGHARSSSRSSTPRRSPRASRTARSRPRSSRSTSATGSATTTSPSGSRSRRSTRTGYTPRLGLSGGAADANVFNGEGLPCVNLANGMTDIHTPDERIAVDDLERMVDVTLALVDAARETRLMPLGLRWGTVTAVPERVLGLVRLEVDGEPCIAYPRLTGAVEEGDTVLVNTQARRARARLGWLRRPLREPHARPRAAAGGGRARHGAPVRARAARDALRRGGRRLAARADRRRARSSASASTASSRPSAPRSRGDASRTSSSRAARCPSRSRTPFGR